jgi:hypothetical protein
MKKLFTLLAAGLFAFAVNAQDTKTSPAKDTKAPASAEKKAATAAAPKYWCSQCDYNSDKAGTCPTHHVALVKEGMFFCKGDEANAMEKPGKCKDGSMTARMDQAYQKKLKMAAAKPEGDKMKAAPAKKDAAKPEEKK